MAIWSAGIYRQGHFSVLCDNSSAVSLFLERPFYHVKCDRKPFVPKFITIWILSLYSLYNSQWCNSPGTDHITVAHTKRKGLLTLCYELKKGAFFNSLLWDPRSPYVIFLVLIHQTSFLKNWTEASISLVSPNKSIFVNQNGDFHANPQKAVVAHSQQFTTASAYL